MTGFPHYRPFPGVTLRLLYNRIICNSEVVPELRHRRKAVKAVFALKQLKHFAQRDQFLGLEINVVVLTGQFHFSFPFRFDGYSISYKLTDYNRQDEQR